MSHELPHQAAAPHPVRRWPPVSKQGDRGTKRPVWVFGGRKKATKKGGKK